MNTEEAPRRGLFKVLASLAVIGRPEDEGARLKIDNSIQ
jgi:hypothetical protein